MARRVGVIVLLALTCVYDVAALSKVAQGPDPETAMSEDVRRMHDALLAVSKAEAEGSTSELRIEFMEGSMSAHRSFNIEAGSLVSKEWTSPGSPMIHREGTVTVPRVAKLLEQLIANEYWNFQGTRFIPDAPMFLFRFYYGELKYVDFRCDDVELEQSPSRLAIRDLFLRFVAETDMRPVAAK